MILDKTKIDLLLARKNLSISDVLESANMNSRTFYDGFKRKMTPRCAGRIAAALGVDVTEIIIQDDER